MPAAPTSGPIRTRWACCSARRWAPPGRSAEFVAVPSLTRWMPKVSAAALLLLIASFYFIGENSRALYLGGFLAAIVTVVLIYSTTHHSNPTSVLLSSGILRWVGDRSYGLYLWHWPVYALTTGRRYPADGRGMRGAETRADGGGGAGVGACSWKRHFAADASPGVACGRPLRCRAWCL